MLMGYVQEVAELLDSPQATGAQVAELLRSHGAEDVKVKGVEGGRGATDFVKLKVPGQRGRSAGGDAPTLGLIGRLGGVGARPAQVGLVSDADGAIAVLAAGAKLSAMAKRGDVLAGDVIVTTQVCPTAPTQPHEPVPFMGSPIDMSVSMAHELDGDMDGVVSVDTTRGNRIVNHLGTAVAPPICQGYILKIPEGVLDVVEYVTGRPAVVLPLTTADITPYGNALPHINSICQPATVASVGVLGVAITAQSVVPGCATGACDPTAVEATARVLIELAKGFTRREFALYEPGEFRRLRELYGSMQMLQAQDVAARDGKGAA